MLCRRLSVRSTRRPKTASGDSNKWHPFCAELRATCPSNYVEFTCEPRFQLVDCDFKTTGKKLMFMLGRILTWYQVADHDLKTPKATD